MGRVLCLFRENAAELYPDELRAHVASHPPPVKPVRRWKAKNFLDHALQAQEDTGKAGNLALEFRMFSKDMETLFECFVQFPQFVEELPDWSLAEDLRVSVQVPFALHHYVELFQRSGLALWTTLNVST